MKLFFSKYRFGETIVESRCLMRFPRRLTIMEQMTILNGFKNAIVTPENSTLYVTTIDSVEINGYRYINLHIESESYLYIFTFSTDLNVQL